MEKIFEVKENDEVIEGVVVTPDAKVLTEASKVYASEFKKALDSGVLLANAFSKHLIDQGLWTEEKEKKITLLNLNIRKNEKKIKNKNQKASEAREIARQLRKDREELHELIYEQSSYTSNTAEGMADDAKINYIYSKCILDKNTRKPVYSSVEDFINKSNTKFAVEAVSNLNALLYDIDPKYKEKYPEEMFFKRFGEDEVTEDVSDIKELLEELTELDKTEQVEIDVIEYSVE